MTATAARTRSPGTMLEALLASFDAALRSPDGMVDPDVLLWTDPDGQWRPLLPSLRTALTQLYTLGPYDPATRTGPVIWLKCVVDRTLPDVSPSAGVVPILYLPDVDRQILRAAGDCPAALQPLVELQYRGAVWHQRNGRDWTVEAFLTSENGLGLDVSLDAATRGAFLRVLPQLAVEPLTSLTGRRLEADDFDRLCIGDPVRDLLSWMSDPEEFRARVEASRWQTFRNVCMRDYDFDPEQDGERKAAEFLADEGHAKWDAVWQRFCEAPKVYRGIANLLRAPATTLLSDSSRRPTINADRETALRRGLEAAVDLPHREACDRVLALDAEHAERRHWVWAELGESPLAMVLEPLARLAALARTPLGGATIEAAVEMFATDGWRCDRAALDAMAGIPSPAENGLVSRVICALYEPWLDKSTRHFQSLVGADAANLRGLATGVVADKDTCVLFADGLRFDVAAMLQERLESRGIRAGLTHRVTAIPTVTATAKALASPAHDKCVGDSPIDDFAPLIGAARQPVSAARLREELTQMGVAVLSAEDLRSASRSEHGGWSEIGQLDSLGHSLGIRLARHVDAEVDAIVDRVVELLEAGWSAVRVVTDHGWLLLPGGLPKVELPHFLVQSKWGRCAAVRGESATTVPTFAWHWNPHVRIASPPGIGVFVTGAEYTHGGISPQECVVPELVAQRGAERLRAEIKGIDWRRMRCKVLVETNAAEASVDIRLNWKLPASSIVAAPKELTAAGEANLAIADDSHEGNAATVVVLDKNGQVLDYKATTVGEG